MSLLKRKQEKDQKAAEDAARMEKRKREQELAVHPLVKGGGDRDVRDAYFQGLVFAAIADDDKIDKSEQAVLADIGASLEMSSEEVEDGIAGVTALTDDGKFSLIEECTKTIKENDITVKLFYAQFIQLWTSHEYNKKELDEYLHQFAEWTGVTLPEAKLLAIKKVIASGDDIDAYFASLADWMGDDALKYFTVKKYGDVSNAILKVRKEKARIAAKKKEEERINAVRAEFDQAIELIGEEHKFSASLPREWLDILSNLNHFNRNDIDWVQECNARLVALRKIPHCYSKLVIDGQEKARRKIVWKLACMNYVHGGTVRSDEINDLLRVAMQLSSEGYNKRIEDYISTHFSDVVSLE